MYLLYFLSYSEFIATKQGEFIQLNKYGNNLLFSSCKKTLNSIFWVRIAEKNLGNQIPSSAYNLPMQATH